MFAVMHTQLSIIAVTAAAVLSGTATAQCMFQAIGTPYGTDSYRLVEWQGNYFDAGFVHLRHRAVTGGEWADTGGPLTAGTTTQFVDPIVAWNEMLVVGGNFGGAGSTVAPMVMGWNGASIVRLGSGFNNSVSALVVWNGKLVAGGDFTATGAGAPTARVAVFDDETAEWTQLGAGLTNLPAGYSTWQVGDLCVHQGQLYATGRFRSSGATTLNGIARFDEASNSWQPLGSGIANMGSGHVGTALESYGGQLWLSGWFTSLSGLPISWMAKWNGVQWTSAGAPATKHALQLRAHGGNLYGVGPGTFNIGGECDMARFDGQSWQCVGSSNINWPNSIEVAEDGTDLLTCGSFNSMGGANSALIRFGCTTTPPCPADLNGDHLVNGTDLSAVLSGWGSADNADINQDGVVDGSDMTALLSAWGNCG